MQKIEDLLRIKERLDQAVSFLVERVDSLEQSVLTNAFRGELVFQDPNEEPASILLERIRATRSVALGSSLNSKFKTKGKKK